MATLIKWEDANFTWDNSSHTWDNVQLVEEAIEEIRQGASIDEVFYGEPDKKKRLVKLICKIQGKTIKQSKEINDYKIKVSDIRLLAKEILNIEVLTENIKF